MGEWRVGDVVGGRYEVTLVAVPTPDGRCAVRGDSAGAVRVWGVGWELAPDGGRSE
jgi:hypothetical protein